MNALEVRSVAAIGLVYALRMLGLFMVMPVFVLLGGDLQGATPALLGMAVGAYGLSQALLQIPYGLLSDRLGRKPLIYLGLALFALGSVLAAESTTIYGVIAGRFLQGSGAIASVLMALLSDLTRDEERTKAMAGVGMSIGIAFSISLVLGPLLGGAIGLQGIFWITALFALVGALAMLFWVPTPGFHTRHLDTTPRRGQLLAVLKDTRLLRLDLGIFVLHLVLTASFLAIPHLLRDQVGMPAESHWWIYLSVMLASFFAMLPFIILGEKRRKMKPVLLGAIGLLSLAVFALAQVTHSLWVLWLELFGFFMAFNLLEASLPSLISKESPAASRGAAMGVYSSSQFMGAFMGGAGGGILLQWYGISVLLQSLLVILLLWLLVACFMQAPRYTNSIMLNLIDLSAADPQEVSATLAAIPGVEDVVVLQGERAAYLKVDRQLLDESQLRACRFVA